MSILLVGRGSLIRQHILITLLAIALLGIVTIYFFPGPLVFILDQFDRYLFFSISLVLIGPFLTFVTYKPNKKNALYDLIVISYMQVIVFCIALVQCYSERPIYFVFAVDRFSIQTAEMLQGRLATDPSLRVELPLMVAARKPDDNVRAMEIMFEVFKGLPDIDGRPELFEPLSVHRVSLESKSLKTLDFSIPELRQYKLLDSGEYLIFPLVVRDRRDRLIVLSKSSLQVVEMIDLDPWRFFQS